jgi:hypothetical protein
MASDKNRRVITTRPRSRNTNVLWYRYEGYGFLDCLHNVVDEDDADDDDDESKMRIVRALSCGSVSCDSSRERKHHET